MYYSAALTATDISDPKVSRISKAVNIGQTVSVPHTKADMTPAKNELVHVNIFNNSNSYEFWTDAVCIINFK